MIASCTCEHKQQDQIHGPGNRVFNVCKTGYRCTVCGKVQDTLRYSTPTKKETKKK